MYFYGFTCGNIDNIIIFIFFALGLLSMVRVKKRYILAEINYAASRKHKIDTKKFISAIGHCIGENFGDCGMAQAGKLNVLFLNEDATLLILGCRRSSLQIVWASMTLLTHIDSAPLFFHVLHVSGTILKLRNAYFKIRSRQEVKHELYMRNGCEKNTELVQEILGISITTPLFDEQDVGDSSSCESEDFEKPDERIIKLFQ
jgi:RNase P/RNase MRP subunit POP5